MTSFLHWAPRILSLVFVAFLSIFALDVVGQYSGWGLVTAFIMHLWPSLVLLILTIISWRFSMVGALTFVGFALWYVWMVRFDQPWSWYVGISLPSLIVGLLYFGDWLRARNNKLTPVL